MSTMPIVTKDTLRMTAEAATADAIIVRSRTQVRGALLAARARCTVVGRRGVGQDSIDAAACEARGMSVIPATGANALSVAEYVIASAVLLLRDAAVTSAVPRSTCSPSNRCPPAASSLVARSCCSRRTSPARRRVGASAESNQRVSHLIATLALETLG